RVGAAAAEERAVAGVIGIELPGDDLAVRREAALDDDHRRGPDRRVHHVLGAGVSDAHRPAGEPRQPRGLVRDGIRALAAETAADLRRDDAHLRLVDAEALRELRADAERALRAGPHRQPVALPLRDGRAWLHRRVRDVGDEVRALERAAGGTKALVEGALLLRHVRVVAGAHQQLRQVDRRDAGVL